MRVSVITTRQHNVGDDFVREGILHLLASIKPLGKVEFIHKHAPIQAVYGLEGIRSLRVSKVIDPVARLVKMPDRVREADLLVQSGAPVYWCHPDGTHCADNEWFDPLIRRRFLLERKRHRFISLAGGSCQHYHSNGDELDSCLKCQNYMREFFDACSLTTLRDHLAKRMLNKAGRDAAVLPCTSIFARDRLSLQGADGEYIVLNFIEHGGPYQLGAPINKELWRRQFRILANTVSKIGRVVVACHSQQEELWAREIVPEVERFLVPEEPLEYMKFYSRAIFGILNRVHGGFMMASLGKPVAVIGNDSRARMISNLNLPSYYVEDVEKIGVENIVDAARSRIEGYPEEIESIRKQAKSAYIASLAEALSN